MTARTSRTRRRVTAPRAAVYRARVGAGAIGNWEFAQGMSRQVHHSDARESGLFRISLTCNDPTGGGKTSARKGT